MKPVSIRRLVDDIVIGCAMPEGRRIEFRPNHCDDGRIAQRRAGHDRQPLCSSGIQTIAQSAERIIADGADVIIAGGAETMKPGAHMTGFLRQPNPAHGCRNAGSVHGHGV